MISVEELMTDPDFVQDFQLVRVTISFGDEGEASTSETTYNRSGVIQPATIEDYALSAPEGERSTNMIRIYCAESLQMSNGVDKESDKILWQGNWYRIVRSKPWQLNGYYFAIAVGFKNG